MQKHLDTVCIEHVTKIMPKLKVVHAMLYSDHNLIIIRAIDVSSGLTCLQ